MDTHLMMARASEALVEMRYLESEALCMTALSQAADTGDWATFGRVLMPLQECRRQRRMIAAEGVTRVGTADLAGDPANWLREHRIQAGWFVVTPPHTATDAAALWRAALDAGLCVEVMCATPDVPAAGVWRFASFAGKEGSVICDRPAPPADAAEKWHRPTGEDDAIVAWLLAAAEALGDAAIDAADLEAMPPADQVMALRRALDVVTDHEIIHQRLGEAVKELRLTRAAAS